MAIIYNRNPLNNGKPVGESLYSKLKKYFGRK